MGATFQFCCGECGYEAEVSGGFDRGMVSVTHTVTCPRCRGLSDVKLWSRWDGEPGDQVLWGMDEDEAVEYWKGHHGLVRCGIDRRHTAAFWRHPGPCPRCGNEMTQGEMTMLWD